MLFYLNSIDYGLNQLISSSINIKMTILHDLSVGLGYQNRCKMVVEKWFSKTTKIKLKILEFITQFGYSRNLLR